jgi:hypothetical protein
MKYKILTVSAVTGMTTNFEHASIELAQLVNQGILDGWKPLGGLATGVTQQMKEPYLFQAMIHE